MIGVTVSAQEICPLAPSARLSPLVRHLFGITRASCSAQRRQTVTVCPPQGSRPPRCPRKTENPLGPESPCTVQALTFFAVTPNLGSLPQRLCWQTEEVRRYPVSFPSIFRNTDCWGLPECEARVSVVPRLKSTEFRNREDTENTNPRRITNWLKEPSPFGTARQCDHVSVCFVLINLQQSMVKLPLSAQVGPGSRMAGYPKRCN